MSTSVILYANLGQDALNEFLKQKIPNRNRYHIECISILTTTTTFLCVLLFARKQIHFDKYVDIVYYVCDLAISFTLMYIYDPSHRKYTKHFRQQNVISANVCLLIFALKGHRFVVCNNTYIKRTTIDAIEGRNLAYQSKCCYLQRRVKFIYLNGLTQIILRKTDKLYSKHTKTSFIYVIRCNFSHLSILINLNYSN